MRKCVALLLLVAGLVLAQPGEAVAFGYKSSGWDPNEPDVTRVDIHKTALSVWQSKDGRWFLNIGLWSYPGGFLGPFGASIQLDSRGGAGADYTIGIDSGEDGFIGCGLTSTTTKHHWDGTVPKKAWGCRVLFRPLHASKRVRWRVEMDSLFTNDRDLAPDDGGWFG